MSDPNTDLGEGAPSSTDRESETDGSTSTGDDAAPATGPVPATDPAPATREADPGRGPPPTAVPPDQTPAVCPYCERPFARKHLRDLHVGEAHADAASEAERTAYDAVYELESDDLFVYHLKVVAAIVMLLMGLAYLYAFVLV